MMRFEKCLKLQTNITFWYQLLISLRYKIEKLLCSEWLCFSNLALAKLVAVCVKAGKLLSWLSVHHVGHHAGTVRGHCLHRGGLEEGGGRGTVRALLLVSELVVVCAEPAPAKPTRVGFLTYKERSECDILWVLQGALPVCILMCLFQVDLSYRVFPQIGHSFLSFGFPMPAVCNFCI